MACRNMAKLYQILDAAILATEACTIEDRKKVRTVIKRLSKSLVNAAEKDAPRGRAGPRFAQVVVALSARPCDILRASINRWIGTYQADFVVITA